ncbi:VanZ family protein [uncultured Xylophilus sp.]|uniref:VanZ family protein n=1 Tax=uncultured Xylophilus sp. TaxID=296832 RepID=UPI0025F1444A|nr:VanZ family protein [uncultured Xylophilus sp.]
MPDTPSSAAHRRRAVYLVALAVLLLALMPLTWPVRLQPPFDWKHQTPLGTLTADHLLAFGVLTWLASRAWHRRLFAVVPLLLLYGVAIECIQLAVPYRTADLTDVVADAVGIGIGLLALALTRLREGRLQRMRDLPPARR